MKPATADLLFLGPSVQTVPKVAGKSVSIFFNLQFCIVWYSNLCNRFNQTTVAYDANKEEKVQALRGKRAEVEERLREKWKAVDFRHAQAKGDL